MASILSELRHGVRILSQTPGTTAIAALTLALGIGLVGAVFSVVNGAILNTLPWNRSNEVMQLAEVRGSELSDLLPVAQGRYVDWTQARSFSSIAAFTAWRASFTDGDRSELIDGALVTADGFKLSGVLPALGRGLGPADAEADAPHAVVISHGLWQRRYGADPSIVGRSIEIDGRSTVVVGVLDELRWFPRPWAEVVGILRLEGSALSRTEHTLGVMARLRPEVTLEQAQQEMRLISSQLEERHPATDAEVRAVVRPLRDQIVPRNTSAAVWILLAGACLVLVIACVNVASLQLARGVTRQKEFSIRSAIGATRALLLRQLVAEGMVLALLAVPLGALAARGLSDLLLALGPSDVSFVSTYFRFDAGVLVACALAGMGTVLVFGLVPALAATRVDLAQRLKEAGGRGSTTRSALRLRTALVVVQLAISLLLLVSSSLLLDRLLRLQKMNPGFQSQDLVVAILELPADKYPDATSWRLFERAILEQLSRLPQVESASAAGWLPLSPGLQRREFTIPSDAAASPDHLPRALWSAASPGYFDTLGLAVSAGRAIEATDDEHAEPVAVVNQALARLYFSGGSPVGQQIRSASDGRARTIVGVAEDSVQSLITDPVQPQVFEPFAQSPGRSVQLAVKTRGRAADFVAQLRNEVSSIDPALSLRTELMEKRLSASLWPQRLFLSIVAVLGVTALTLAVVGIYGLTSYATYQRYSEFGIRMALGAGRTEVARLVVRNALWLALLGVVIGTPVTWAVARVLAAALPAMPSLQPSSLMLYAFVLTAIAVLASTVPALRASRIDPASLLRTGQ